MKTLRHSRLIGFAAAASIVALPAAVFGDWRVDLGGNSAGDPQDVVITLKVNPLTNPETACLAVTLARSLRGYPEGVVNNVTLFPTLDGVALGDAKIVGNPKFKCTTPWGELSLRENLDAFLGGNDDNMVVCPICWRERYDAPILPDYGVLGDRTSVGDTLLNADKILDF